MNIVEGRVARLVTQTAHAESTAGKRTVTASVDGIGLGDLTGVAR